MNFRLTPSTGTTRSFSALENKVKESGQKDGKKGKKKGNKGIRIKSIVGIPSGSGYL